MNKKYILIGLVLIVAISLGIFLFSGSVSEKTDKIKVVTTLFPYYDFSKIIGGDKADVSLLLPPGVEAHAFEPKPSDIFKINRADIFVYTGDFMELWAKDILSGLENNNLTIVRAGDSVGLFDSGANKLEIDPHIWLDFYNSDSIANAILAAFLAKDPQNSMFYIQNTDKLKRDLADLDMSYRSGLADCQTKTLVYGGHYAFGYLVKKYNLNYLAAQGLSPDSEPTVQDLALLVNEIRKDNINYIFYEELSSPKIAETISAETGVKMLLLNAAHNISRDDLSAGVSFIDIMKENLINLRTGLECR